MDFFTSEDLELLLQHADRNFKLNNKAHQRIEQELLSGPIAKTKFWAKLLGGTGFKVSMKYRAWRQAGTVTDTDGNRTMRRLFKPFTWASLFLPGQQQFGVFFTLGIDAASQTLMWKLDCLRQGVAALDTKLIVRFDDFMRTRGGIALPVMVPVAELPNWNWPRLAAATKSYLATNKTIYLDAIDYVWQGRNPLEDKLARICWNTSGWQVPSGPEGKSQDANSHERSDGPGFGAEEWLFNFSRLAGNYHYAFLQPLNNDAHEGKVYNIKLYSRNSDTQEYFYVGRIRNAEVLTDAMNQKIHTKYEAKGWYAEMADELCRATANPAAELFSPMFLHGPFNFRFRPEDVERPDTDSGVELIEEFSTWTNNHRYVLLADTSPEATYNPSWNPQPKIIPKVILKGGKQGKQPKSRTIQGGSIELKALHQQVQRNLCKVLKEQYPGELVVKEAAIQGTNTRIDVVRETPTGLVFYEVKVLHSIRACIREALGQLLEYACWSDPQLSQEWVIVSHHTVTQEAEEYLDRLQATFDLPISYMQVGLTTTKTPAATL
ncbi:hypothetical protein D0N36_16240 [Hymenobacter lapidiphilus]|uniref:hypothetical protein n=1 Tax=Hymenobacter sp. CCM 8763 TaxID=2303334 RepID=UPI000E353A58|nr:hypothetical protein [Hymenobacter sp. CCM 8763]RFP64076.1 hypothetical protein D0N36_16240 [Hymenobacter sp. CCM 8763]